MLQNYVVQYLGSFPPWSLEEIVDFKKFRFKSHSDPFIFQVDKIFFHSKLF